MRKKTKMAKKETKTININFVVEPSFHDRLIAQSEKERRTLSSFIRTVLEDYLEAKENEKSRKK